MPKMEKKMRDMEGKVVLSFLCDICKKHTNVLYVFLLYLPMSLPIQWGRIFCPRKTPPREDLRVLSSCCS